MVVFPRSCTLSDVSSLSLQTSMAGAGNVVCLVRRFCTLVHFQPIPPSLLAFPFFPRSRDQVAHGLCLLCFICLILSCLIFLLAFFSNIQDTTREHGEKQNDACGLQFCTSLLRVSKFESGYVVSLCDDVSVKERTKKRKKEKASQPERFSWPQKRH